MQCLGKDMLKVVAWDFAHFTRGHHHSHVANRGELRQFMANNFVDTATHPIATNGTFEHLLANHNSKSRVSAARIGDIFDHK